MSECTLRNIHHSFFQKPMFQCEFSEPLAQIHMFLKFIENLLVEVISM